MDHAAPTTDAAFTHRLIIDPGPPIILGDVTPDMVTPIEGGWLIDFGDRDCGA